MATDQRAVFVGRAGELGVLGDVLSEVRSGAARTVVVHGPPGIGKTAIVDRFLEGEDDLRVLRASGEQWEALVSYGLLDQLMRVAGVGSTRLLASRHQVLPVEEPVSVGTWFLETIGALEQLSPVVVVIDDAQWADMDSLRAILFAVRRLVTERVLTVLTIREEDMPRFPEGLLRLAARPTGTALRLGTLGPAEVQRIAAALGTPNLPLRTAQRLCEHTRGNPLYVRALLAELPSDALRTWQPALPAPRTFAVQVERRLAACTPGTRRFVEAAAALGTQSALSTVVALAGGGDPLPALEEARLADLLVVRDERRTRVVAFTHPLVQAAVYEHMGPSEQVRLHRAAAVLAEDEGTVLRHRVTATAPPDDGLAADLDAFARREEARGAWAGAAAALVEASRMSAGRELREQRLLRAVDAMIGSGDLLQAAAFAEEIMGFEHRAMRDAALGYLAVLRGRPADAEALLQRAWDRPDLADEPQVAAIVAQRWALHSVGRLRAADVLTWTGRAIGLSSETAIRAETDAIRVLGVGWAGEMDEALALLSGSRVADPDSGLSGRSFMPHGWLRMVDDDLDGARALLAEAATSQLRSGAVRIAVWAHVWLARAEFLAGAWDDAAVSAEQAVELLEETGHEWLRPLARWVAASVSAARGAWRAADEHVRVATAQAADYELMIVAAALAQAQPAAAQGDHSAVLRAFGPVLALRPLPGLDEPGFWPWHDLYAEALVGAGRLDEADVFLAPHEELAAARGRRSSIARLARVRGRLEAAAGRPRRAEEAFQRGLAALDELALPFDRALLELAYGEILRRSQQRRAAVTHLQAAQGRLAALDARPYLARCERELTASGLAPAKRQEFDPSRLTARELAVARLVVAGLSNSEAAARLFLSAKTVQSHLTRIYAKLGVRSRTELAAHLRDVPAGPDGAG